MSFRILTVLLSVSQLFCFAHGDTIDIAEAPWQASVLVNDRHRCGGVIYSKDFVLTIAQCVKGVIWDNIAVRVGSAQKDLGGQVVPIRHVTMQALGLRPSDVAILALEKSLVLSDNVKPIDLAHWSLNGQTRASVTGWTESLGDEPGQELLIRTDLEIVGKLECRGDYLIKRILAPDELCCSKSNSTNLICQGFSGGPLVSEGKLIGIGSWHSRCDFLHSPSVYANIPMIKLWISSTIKLLDIF